MSMGLREEAVNGLNSERIERITETMHENLRRQAIKLHLAHISYPFAIRPRREAVVRRR